MQIKEGTQVDIEVANGVLRVVASQPRYSLHELVKGIRRGNIPDEIFDDGPKGRELI
jgi:antitoxin component of MazEF toxin-antitoxin module